MGFRLEVDGRAASKYQVLPDGSSLIHHSGDKEAFTRLPVCHFTHNHCQSSEEGGGFMTNVKNFSRFSTDSPKPLDRPEGPTLRRFRSPERRHLCVPTASGWEQVISEVFEQGSTHRQRLQQALAPSRNSSSKPSSGGRRLNGDELACGLQHFHQGRRLVAREPSSVLVTSVCWLTNLCQQNRCGGQQRKTASVLRLRDERHANGELNLVTTFDL